MAFARKMQRAPSSLRPTSVELGMVDDGRARGLPTEVELGVRVFIEYLGEVRCRGQEPVFNVASSFEE